MSSPTALREWLPSDVDYVIAILRNAKDEAKYKGLCDCLAIDLDRVAVAGKPPGAALERFVWGLVTRYREYTPGDGRGIFRTGPFTWAEEYWMTLACDTATEERTKYPDAAYFALLLNRPIADVEPAWKKHGPARGRNSLFDLKK